MFSEGQLKPGGDDDKKKLMNHQSVSKSYLQHDVQSEQPEKDEEPTSKEVVTHGQPFCSKL